MERRYVKDSVGNLSLYDLPSNVKDLVEFFESLEEAHVTEPQTWVSIDWESDEGYGFSNQGIITGYVYLNRPETDEEQQKRVTKALMFKAKSKEKTKQLKLDKIAKEKKEYERLKKKYYPMGDS